MGDSEKDPLNGSFKQRTEEDEVVEEAQEPELAPDDDLAVEDDEPDSTETEDDEDELFAARAGSVRPAVSSGQRKTPGKHAQSSGGKASVFDFDGEIPGLGVSMRTIAVLAAVAAAVSLIVSMIVSCSVQGAAQSQVDRKYREFEASMTEQFEQQKAEVSELQNSLGDQVQEISTAQEVSAAVQEAKTGLQAVVDEAKEWLEDGRGRRVSDDTEDMMRNAIDVAERLISETGVTDPQTYAQAEDTIQDIMEGVEDGRLW